MKRSESTRCEWHRLPSAAGRQLSLFPPAHPRNRSSWAAICLTLLPLLLSGCAWWTNKIALMRQGDPTFGPRVQCRVPPHPTAEELVDYLNQNVERVQAWRASRVRLRANNIPLTADIAVEKERRLRIVVNSVAGNELDLGSNQDVFWFWAKRQQPAAVLYANHEQLDVVRETLQIPFEPGWLMEALGVAPIPLEGTSIESAGPNLSRLTSSHVNAHGRPMRKVITVDTCHGRIMEHSIWDASGRRIAHAQFTKHRLDPATGVILAHGIRIEWPQADITLVMDLGQVEVNPIGMPTKIFDMPHMPGYPVMNLEDVALNRGNSPARRSQFAAESAAGLVEEMNEDLNAEAAAEESPVRQSANRDDDEIDWELPEERR